jgi:hypothetical protein
MRAAIGRLLLSAPDNPRLHRRRNRSQFAAAMLRLQSGYPTLFKAALPFGNRGGTSAQLLFDLAIAQPFSQRQDQARSKYISGGQGSGLRPAI